MFQVQNLSFSYKREPVFSGLNFNLQPGEMVGIIGPNGAGKTTLLKNLTGLFLQNGQGQILLDKRLLSEFSSRERAKKIGYVPQESTIPDFFTVEEVVALGRFPWRSSFFHPDYVGEEIINRAIEMMELSALRDRPYGRLSGGEKQRTVIASVLAQQAELIFLDEPTSALDLKHQQSIYQALQGLTRNFNKTIVIVTHDVNLASQYCTRLMLMAEGRILRDGAPAEVLQFPLIQETYGVQVYIDINPFNRALYIIPYDTIGQASVNQSEAVVTS